MKVLERKRLIFRLYKHTHGAFCALCIICSPILAMYMGMMAVAMGTGLILKPDLMMINGGPAFKLLLDVMPQSGWEAALLVSGTVQLFTFWIGGVARFVSLFCTFILWTFMTWVTLDAEYSLAPWIYGTMSFKTLITLASVAWIEGLQIGESNG